MTLALLGIFGVDFIGVTPLGVTIVEQVIFILVIASINAAFLSAHYKEQVVWTSVALAMQALSFIVVVVDWVNLIMFARLIVTLVQGWRLHSLRSNLLFESIDEPVTSSSQ